MGVPREIKDNENRTALTPPLSPLPGLLTGAMRSDTGQQDNEVIDSPRPTGFGAQVNPA